MNGVLAIEAFFQLMGFHACENIGNASDYGPSQGRGCPEGSLLYVTIKIVSGDSVKLGLSFKGLS
jgi:hypothetical protein